MYCCVSKKYPLHLLFNVLFIFIKVLYVNQELSNLCLITGLKVLFCFMESKERNFVLLYNESNEKGSLKCSSLSQMLEIFGIIIILF